MGSEAATMLNAGLIELDDCILRPVDCGKHIQLVIPALERIVRFVTRFLQGDEGVGEVLYFERKPLHRLSVPASAPCASVLRGAVHLMPGLAAVSADEQVGRRAGQAVEQGVVRGADGAAEIRLRGPPRAALRQAAGRGHQVARVQGAGRPDPGMARLIQPAAGLPKAPAPGPRPRRAGSGGSCPGVRGGEGADLRVRELGMQAVNGLAHQPQRFPPTPEAACEGALRGSEPLAETADRTHRCSKRDRAA